MHSLHIERSACCGDGLCVRSCFLHCLELDGERKAVWNDDAATRCVGCGHCVAVCPRAALRLDEIPPADLPAAAHGLTSDQIAAFLTSRRSIRHFKKRPVPRETLLRAIRTAGYAPTGTNRRDVGYIIVDTPAVLDALRAALAQWMRPFPRWKTHVDSYDQGEDAIFRGAPGVVALYAPHSTPDACEAPAFMSPQAAAGAASYLELVLHGMGIGTCWSGLIVRGASACAATRHLLAVPDGQTIYAAFMVGYPTIHYQRIPYRSVPPTLFL